MWKYLRCLALIRKIGFSASTCSNIYHLQILLPLFMEAEGKVFTEENGKRIIQAKPLGSTWVVSRLPQFSEVIHERIQKLREHYDAKLSRERVLPKHQAFLQKQTRFEPLSLSKDGFFEHNEALFLTYAGEIPGVDMYQDVLREQ